MTIQTLEGLEARRGEIVEARADDLIAVVKLLDDTRAERDAIAAEAARLREALSFVRESGLLPHCGDNNTKSCPCAFCVAARALASPSRAAEWLKEREDCIRANYECQNCKHEHAKAESSYARGLEFGRSEALEEAAELLAHDPGVKFNDGTDLNTRQRAHWSERVRALAARAPEQKSGDEISARVADALEHSKPLVAAAQKMGRSLAGVSPGDAQLVIGSPTKTVEMFAVPKAGEKP